VDLAQGGTIFLDEISTMDAKAQVSLLRLLETKSLRRLGGRKVIKVDVRLIAATGSIRAGMTLHEVEKVYVAETLSATGGNKLKAVKALGISRRALYNKLARHHLL
jgi:DNA-binding NtrC family response regulator